MKNFLKGPKSPEYYLFVFLLILFASWILTMMILSLPPKDCGDYRMWDYKEDFVPAKCADYYKP